MAVRRRFTVELEMPRGVSVAAMASYIEGAVAEMKGCYHPDDPLFNLDGGKVHCLRQSVVVNPKAPPRICQACHRDTKAALFDGCMLANCPRGLKPCL